MLHEEFTARIIASAMNEHSALAAGLLESTYDACLRYECIQNGLQFQHQTRLPIIYKTIELEFAYRIDFVSEFQRSAHA